MTTLSELLMRLRMPRISEQEVRAEAWALGARHYGRVLEGARAEAQAPGTPFRRVILLRAVMQRQAALNGASG